MEKKQRGPKPVIYDEECKPFFIRKFPVKLRRQAHAKAVDEGITLREWLVQTLTKELSS